MALVSEDRVREEVARVSRLARAEVRRGSALAAVGSPGVTAALAETSLRVENGEAPASASSPGGAGADALSPSDASRLAQRAANLGEGARAKMAQALQGVAEAYAGRNELARPSPLSPASATAELRELMALPGDDIRKSAERLQPPASLGPTMAERARMPTSPSTPPRLAAMAERPRLSTSPSVTGPVSIEAPVTGASTPAVASSAIETAERLAAAVADRLRARASPQRTLVGSGFFADRQPTPTPPRSATEERDPAFPSDRPRTPTPDAPAELLAQSPVSAVEAVSEGRRTPTPQHRFSAGAMTAVSATSPLGVGAQSPAGSGVGMVTAESIVDMSLPRKEPFTLLSEGALRIDTATVNSASPSASRSQKIAAQDAKAEVRELSSRLAAEAIEAAAARELSVRLTAEVEAAAFGRDEAQALRRERDAARDELQTLRASRGAEEDNQLADLRQTATADLQLLRAQLRACELEEGTASERCSQVEVWLQGAASEAREALAMARRMTAEEAASVAEVTAASEARDAAVEEARVVRARLRTFESSGGGHTIYREVMEEVEAAKTWRDRALEWQKMEAAAEARVSEVESESQDKIEELENRLRSMESRQAKARAAAAQVAALAKAREDDTSSPTSSVAATSIAASAATAAMQQRLQARDDNVTSPMSSIAAPSMSASAAMADMLQKFREDIVTSPTSSIAGTSISASAAAGAMQQRLQFREAQFRP